MAASRFTKAEIKRAVEAARETGFLTGAIELKPDGTFRFEFGVQKIDETKNEWEQGIGKL